MSIGALFGISSSIIRRRERATVKFGSGQGTIFTVETELGIARSGILKFKIRCALIF
jgi:hypothetical protein